MKTTWEEFIEKPTLKLNKDNFIQQIVEFGYFTEQFPSCFSSKLFSSKLNELLPLSPCTKKQIEHSSKNANLPTALSMRKNNISRRILSLPNPKSFLRLAKLMQENWNNIQSYAESSFSLSPITYIHKYNDFGERAMLNSENVRESLRSKSDFVEGIRNCIQVSLGYRFRLKVDIANCYNSIYTHSIAWAICGKDDAKKYLRTKEPESLKNRYELADKLDAFMRFQKNNETNGIVVGPFTSRIFSEIILAAIDKQLANKGYIFRRYVDDYKFYFKSEADAKGSVPHIERLLNEYDLQLNISKTEIDCFPFEIVSQMKDTYKEALSKDGVFGVLNVASLLYLNGEKGAYKYALKFIDNHEPSIDDLGVIISSLINILIIEPKYGKYIIQYLKKYFHKWDKKLIEELLNKELGISINDELQQEALVFLHIIKELKLTLSAENLIDILCCSNDFAIIIALDIWKNKNKLIIRTRSQATAIKKGIEKLSVELKGEEYSGARWLLLYEIKFHKLIDDILFPAPTKDIFFDELYKNQVTFFQSIKYK